MKFTHLFRHLLVTSRAGAYLVSPPGTAAPGTTEDCTQWVEYSSGLTCELLETYFGMMEAGFEEWNPIVTELGNGCESFYQDYTAACRLTSPPFLGVTCADIAGDAGISLTDFVGWNPSVGLYCSGLWLGYYVCIAAESGTNSCSSSSTVSTTTTTTTITTTGNGVTTPTPYEPAITYDCDESHLVVSNDTCAAIVFDAGITFDDFYNWNPTVGYYVCVGEINTY
ncbi:hypothetical protein BDW68DRAFT_181273 [Aspergillus falconensis]